MGYNKFNILVFVGVLMGFTTVLLLGLIPGDSEPILSEPTRYNDPAVGYDWGEGRHIFASDTTHLIQDPKDRSHWVEKSSVNHPKQKFNDYKPNREQKKRLMLEDAAQDVYDANH